MQVTTLAEAVAGVDGTGVDKGTGLSKEEVVSGGEEDPAVSCTEVGAYGVAGASFDADMAFLLIGNSPQARKPDDFICSSLNEFSHNFLIKPV